MQWIKHVYVFVFGFLLGIVSEVYGFFVTLIPTKFEFEYGSIGAILCAVYLHVCGSYSRAVDILVILMGFDMLSGILASLINKDFMLNSKKGWRGVMKKALTLIVVFTAYHTGSLIPGSDGELLKDCTACFFSVNEIISIIENAGKCGLPIPPILSEKLEQLKLQRERKGVLLNEKSDDKKD